MSRVRVRRHVRRRAKRPRESPLAREILAPSSQATEGGIPVFTKYPGRGGSMMGEDILSRGEIQIGEDTLRESAASTLDDLLGFGIVPPTVLRVVERPGGRPKGVSVQLFVEGTNTLDEYEGELEPDHLDALRNDFIKIAVFDIIVGARDRHPGNVLVTPFHAYAIDNEEIMTGLGPRMFHESYYPYVEGDEIPSGVRRALERLTKEDFFAAFAGIEPAIIEKAWNRKLKLQGREYLPKSRDILRMEES